MPIKTSDPWSQSIEQLTNNLNTDLKSGLTTQEVATRQNQFGPNRLTSKGERTLLQVFFSQFADLMVGLLMLAAFVSGLNGEWIDTILISIIIIVDAIVGSWQEWKADNAVAALKNLSRPIARVRRDGHLVEIPAEELVPGDVIEVHTGDLTPADARVISAASLEADESPLTGESLPVEKSPEQKTEETQLADRTCIIHSGTSIVHGRGTAIVVATGMETQIGHIATLLAESEAGVTPLQQRLKSLNHWIVLAVIFSCAVIFVAGLIQETDDPWSSKTISRMLLISVSLAVAAIPEGLPAIITITLALGAQRMATRKAMIRQLSAVEALGSVNVICSDKTGTLTQNKMVVSDLVTREESEAAQLALVEASALCNNSQILADGQISGSGTEAALIKAAVERGVDIARLHAANRRVGEIPFSSATKRMATIHLDGQSQQRIFVKGAPDQLLALCRFPDEQEREEWFSKIQDLTEQGRRVLAVANIRHDGAFTDSHLQPDTLNLMGIIGMIDPVRPEVRGAVEVCKSAGIRTIMVTGDHPGTATAIAKELNFLDEDAEVITGAQLETMTAEELDSRINKVGIFARVTPKHKIQIVRALQAQNNLVAMTGDGVNDAPALKQADVGVAMGITGTDVSKQAANIVLADDNFATIVSAVEEGRVVYDNIVKAVVYLLSANLSEVVLLLFAILLGLPLPLLTIHLLWINLVTDGFPALALGFEPPERNLMRRTPRHRSEKLLTPGILWGILSAGLLMAVTCLCLFQFELGSTPEANEDKARTTVFFVLSVTQLFYVCGLRSFSTPLFQTGMLSNWRLTAAVTVGVLMQISLLYVPPLQKIFHLVPLSISELILCLTVSTIPLIAVEVWKLIQSGQERNTVDAQ
ncbi:cation-translocating P-type ATPase [Planctomicrobium sp. SH527]|uniref:cation-translocating P-type ATPase n=1 Tax=Planctomicrobium sp. SH527 TaxID=3448123 RepID=UPI003F5C2882